MTAKRSRRFASTSNNKRKQPSRSNRSGAGENSTPVDTSPQKSMGEASSATTPDKRQNDSPGGQESADGENEGW